MERKECCCCSGRTRERRAEEVKKLIPLGLTLNPMFAAAAMSLSSFCVWCPTLSD